MPETRRSFLKAMLAGTIGAGAGALGHGYAYERHALALVAVDLPVTGLSHALDGLRVGFITDLHHSGYVPQTAVAHAADLLMAQRPDLIVLGGDYVTNFDRRYMRPCAEALSSLTAEHGVFAVFGNHDDDREMPAALHAHGFVVLKDMRTSVAIRGERLDLVGIRFWTRELRSIARLVDSRAPTTLLLAHDPRRLVQAAQLALPAVLSGHTHGGQVVVPGIGPLAGRRFPVVAGSGERDGTTIFVSRGVGTVLVPVRINCPPEVAIVTLRAPRR
jgi:predicted MPP superfamily phosphohydrolase